jgi:hypothetical protein
MRSKKSGTSGHQNTLSALGKSHFRTSTSKSAGFSPCCL